MLIYPFKALLTEKVFPVLQQEYTSLRDQHLRTGQGFLLVCALNDATSFEEMKELHEAILRVKDDGEKVPFVIAANKSVCNLPSPSFLRALSLCNNI